MCRGDCAKLHITASGGQEKVYQGSQKRMRQKDVAKVRTVGTGCFLIHKGRGFTGEEFLVEGPNTLDLKENEVEMTVVK